MTKLMITRVQSVLTSSASGYWLLQISHFSVPELTFLALKHYFQTWHFWQGQQKVWYQAVNEQNNIVSILLSVKALGRLYNRTQYKQSKATT